MDQKRKRNIGLESNHLKTEEPHPTPAPQDRLSKLQKTLGFAHSVAAAQHCPHQGTLTVLMLATSLCAGGAWAI